MPPWFDWLDYIGADAIGRVIGLWFRFCVSLPRNLFRLVIGTTTAVRKSPYQFRSLTVSPPAMDRCEQSPHCSGESAKWRSPRC